MAQIIRDRDEPRIVRHDVEPEYRRREIDVTETDVDRDVGLTKMQQFVYTVATILNGLLVIRMLMSLFGANPANAFANFIYTLTNPFVAPFRGLFGYDLALGRSRFEGETLFAIIIYSLLAYAIVRMIGLGKRRVETY
jgi:YggT family protein